MKTNLSSYLTAFYKYVFSGLAIGFLVFIYVIDLIIEEDLEIDYLLLFPIAIFFLLHFFVLRKLRNVSIDDDNYLIINSNKKHIKIHISNVKDVNDFRLFRPRIISLELKKETVFGNTILFLEKDFISIPFTEAESVKIIKKRMEQYKEQKQ